jgi:hypothetical protein
MRASHPTRSRRSVALNLLIGIIPDNSPERPLVVRWTASLRVVSSDEGYRAALEAVARASETYRAGLTNDAAMTAHTGGGVTPWVPIYRQLLADLRAALHAAGHRYDQAAAAADIPVADRFDWRAILQAEGNAQPDGAADER